MRLLYPEILFWNKNFLSFCTACKEIIDVLNNDPVISGLIAVGTMAVLNIYIDEDLEASRPSFFLTATRRSS